MSTLARSSNNVSLIYLEYFLSYLLVPNFVNQLFLVSRYHTTIKKAFLKKFGAKYVVSIHGFCAVQLAVDKRRYTDPDPNHPKGMHPKSAVMAEKTSNHVLIKLK